MRSAAAGREVSNRPCGSMPALTRADRLAATATCPWSSRCYVAATYACRAGPRDGSRSERGQQQAAALQDLRLAADQEASLPLPASTARRSPAHPDSRARSRRGPRDVLPRVGVDRAQIDERRARPPRVGTVVTG